MLCKKCQFENPKGIKFCGECGAKLERTCPSCNSSNPPIFKFCGECGHKLDVPVEKSPKDLSFDEKLDKIRRYLPKGITKKILTQRERIEGERKQVTVMFCDMEGFTQFTEKLGPEEAYNIMDQVYEILIHKVHDYEGTVNEMTGDGIMALFGAPIALEDAPQRAIRSAYAIHREMTIFSEKIKQEKESIPPLKMRIGIHTGPVVVGALGNDLRVEFKAVGDTVNLASRMENLAESGATYVSEETFKLTEGLFRYEFLGEKEVKGKEEPVKTYRVIGPSTRRTRFDVSAERGLTPIVGRERELDLLLDGFERARAGRGQAFSIMAEAGVGKSRLIYEFIKSISNEDVTILEGKCLSYSRGASYHPVIDILKSNFDILEGDEDFKIKEKVTRGLKKIQTDEASTLPYLLELLSVKDSGIDEISKSPEDKKLRFMEALRRITLKGSEIRPVIMAVEDLHWIDNISEDVLRYLFESIAGAKVLLIFTYRPEFLYTWGTKSYHSQINLNRLSIQESLSMATHLLGVKGIDEELENLILEKTEGIPFFIEEFIKSLRDLKVIKRKNNKYLLAGDIQDLTIPSTIQDVIMARVDNLPEVSKEVIQTGSVIEREFSYELIKRSMDLSERELLSHLSILKDVELLYERGIYPKSTYIFKHALTREVVYDSILTKKKKILHEEIGNTIEEIHKENIDEYCGVLSDHFIYAENYEKGAAYSGLAGAKAIRKASVNDAITWTEKRVLCLDKLPITEDTKKEIIDARTNTALYYTYRGGVPESRDIVRPVVDWAVELNYRKRIAQIYTVLGTCSGTCDEDFDTSFRYLNEALKISIELDDDNSLNFANYWMGVISSLDCQFEKSELHFKEALRINKDHGNAWGVSLMKSMLTWWVYYRKGKVALAYETAKEAMRISEESQDNFSKAMAYSIYSGSCLGMGFLEDGVQYSGKSMEPFSRLTVSWPKASSNEVLAQIYFDKEKYNESEYFYKQAYDILLSAGITPSWRNLMEIGAAKAAAGVSVRASDWERFKSYDASNKIRLYSGAFKRYITELLLYDVNGCKDEAEFWVTRAIETDSENGMMLAVAQDYALYADWFQRMGDQSRCRETLAKAIDKFYECGAEGWVEKYKKELDVLS